MTDPAFADAYELLAYQRETDRLAQENLALSYTNYDNIWPWRFLRWRRTHKQIQANLQEINRRLAVGKRGFATVFEKQVRRP